MYISYNREENTYLLHISIKKEIPQEINKTNLLVFENDIYLKTASKLFDLLSKSNSKLNEWKMVPENYIYGYINGEVVLRVEKTR